MSFSGVLRALARRARCASTQLAGAIVVCVFLGLCSAIPASAKTYTPPPGKVWAGLAGGTSIGQWPRLTNHHPPVFQDYMTWNSGTT